MRKVYDDTREISVVGKCKISFFAGRHITGYKGGKGAIREKWF